MYACTCIVNQYVNHNSPGCDSLKRNALCTNIPTHSVEVNFCSANLVTVSFLVHRITHHSEYHPGTCICGGEHNTCMCIWHCTVHVHNSRCAQNVHRMRTMYSVHVQCTWMITHGVQTYFPSEVSVVWLSADDSSAFWEGPTRNPIGDRDTDRQERGRERRS